MKKLRVIVNGIPYDVEVEILQDDDTTLATYGLPNVPFHHPPYTASPVTSHAPAISNVPKPKTPEIKTDAKDKVLTSPIAGTVIEVKVTPGSQVEVNQPLVVIEAMKMNTNISSPVSGKVKEIKVKAGDNVQSEQVLLTFE